MSILLPQIDLTTAVVGTKFTIDLTQVGYTSDLSNYQNKAHLRLLNDTCMGLAVTLRGIGKALYVSAGQWPTITLEPGTTLVDFICTYQILPVPSVCILSPYYYGPGEELDDLGVLGNTPQNIGGSGLTVSTLSNEGNPLNTEVIDIGPVGFPRAIDIFNDHFIWSVIQAGVLHQVLKGQTAGNPLQIGQAGDIAEVLGSILVDQTIEPAKPSTPVNGSVSGTATLFTAVWGASLKIFVLQLVNYNSAGTPTFLFPSSASGGGWHVGNLGASMTWSFFNGGVAQNVSITSALGNTTTAGTSGTASSIHGDSLGQLISTADRVILGSTAAAAHTASIIFIGE